MNGERLVIPDWREECGVVSFQLSPMSNVGLRLQHATGLQLIANIIKRAVAWMKVNMQAMKDKPPRFEKGMRTVRRCWWTHFKPYWL